MTNPKSFTVEVTQTFVVTIDQDKFTPEFLSEFRDGMYNFHTLAEHAEHIAQMQARGLYELDVFPSSFVEGYGELDEAGVKLTQTHTDTVSS